MRSAEKTAFAEFGKAPVPTPRAQSIVRSVTGFTAACVLVSNVIGTGIFTTTGFLARDIGDPSLILLLWVIGGALSLAGALSYSELGAAMPHVGGEYVYIREAYGRMAAFLSGWASFTVGFGAALAASVMGFSSYCLALFRELGFTALPLNDKSVALVALWGLTVVHTAGVGVGGLVQRVLTAVKVGAIGVLIVAGFGGGHGNWGNLGITNLDTQFSLSKAAVSLIFITFAYSGWNAAGYIAGEIINPVRNLPKAMVGGTVFVSILYVALNVVYLYALPVTELQGVVEVAEKAAVGLFGPRAALFVTVLLCLSILGSASAMIWAGPRVYYAMAEDGVFPTIVSHVRGAYGAPVKAIILQSFWATLLVVTGTFEQLVVYAGFVLALFSSVAVGSVIVLRWRAPQMQRPFRVRPYPLVPLIFVVVSTATMVWTLIGRPVESLLGVATVLSGLPAYFFFGASKKTVPQ